MAGVVSQTSIYPMEVCYGITAKPLTRLRIVDPLAASVAHNPLILEALEILCLTRQEGISTLIKLALSISKLPKILF